MQSYTVRMGCTRVRALSCQKQNKKKTAHRIRSTKEESKSRCAPAHRAKVLCDRLNEGHNLPLPFPLSVLSRCRHCPSPFPSLYTPLSLLSLPRTSSRYNSLSIESCPEQLCHAQRYGHLSGLGLYNLPSLFNHACTRICFFSRDYPSPSSRTLIWGFSPSQNGMSHTDES